MSILEIRDLNKSFGGLKAVSEVGFSVNENAIKAVIGPNGAGKTTLFNLISGALPLDSGTTIFKDREIQGLQPYQIAGLGILGKRDFGNGKNAVGQGHIVFHGGGPEIAGKVGRGADECSV